MTLAELLADVERTDLGRVPFVQGGTSPSYAFLAKLVRRLRPNHVLELGTGVGRSGAFVMSALPAYGTFTTVNLPNPPSGDDVGRELAPWKNDPRLKQILGDSRDLQVRRQVPNPVIDLFFIDSGAKHECALVSSEWALWEDALADGCVVLADDIDANDMRLWWNPLPYEKAELPHLNPGSGFGAFIYRRQA